VTETEKIVDETLRAANVGVSISLKKFHPDDVKVYELSLEDILSLSKELKDILLLFQEQAADLENEDGIGALVVLLANPHTMKALRTVAAGSTRKTSEDFTGMSASDWMKWAIAFKAVNDWEELRQLFFQLIPRQTLSSLVGTTSSKSSTDSEVSTAGLPKRS
jgi:hypothetical protein